MGLFHPVCVILFFIYQTMFSAFLIGQILDQSTPLSNQKDNIWELPNAISSLLSGLASTFFNQLLNPYGTEALAAMGAAG